MCISLFSLRKRTRRRNQSSICHSIEGSLEIGMGLLKRYSRSQVLWLEMSWRKFWKVIQILRREMKLQNLRWPPHRLGSSIRVIRIMIRVRTYLIIPLQRRVLINLIIDKQVRLR